VLLAWLPASPTLREKVVRKIIALTDGLRPELLADDSYCDPMALHDFERLGIPSHFIRDSKQLEDSIVADGYAKQ
jgi:hypothetical protein